MKNINIILLCFLMSGCQFLPQINWPKFSSNDTASQTSSALAATIASSKAAADVVKKTSEADKKVEEARKVMEADYTKFRVDMQKAYDDKKKKDSENFEKINELNFGIYHVTQFNKKTDINTTIAHLRSKEIMARTGLLNEIQQENIKMEVDEERSKTIDDLYIKYNASIYLATSQKAALEAAEALIIQKEKEKQTIREVNKSTIDKLEKERQEQFDKIKKDTENQVTAAKESQRIEMISYMVKALIGVGILFFILGVLLKSITMIASSVGALLLAYTAATIPIWVVGLTVSLITLLVLWVGFHKSVREKLKPTV